MNSVSLEVFGHYNPHHENLKKLGLTACERDVFGKIAGLSRSVKEVFVHLKEFAENLFYLGLSTQLSRIFCLFEMHFIVHAEPFKLVLKCKPHKLRW